eukprot:scaffold197021_cov68-Attheya_sp.AAC.3
MKRRRDDGPPGEKSGKKNAFALLMKATPSPKQKPSQNHSGDKGSRFVKCPANCGAHVSVYDLDSHLDVCCATSVPVHKDEQSTSNAKEASREGPRALDDDPSHGSSVNLQLVEDETHPATRPDLSQSKESVTVDRTETTEKSQTSSQESSTKSGSKSNAFLHMMEKSHAVFKETKPLKARFHLQRDGVLSWVDIDPVKLKEGKEWEKGSMEDAIHVEWSCNTLVKPSKLLQAETIEPLKQLELNCSSSLPSSDDMKVNHRLLPRHSRLSVPVLKSVLQKSIRRRRPLPAVRVAMELADKSLGDLLRRLPIIMLEDSMLHPDLPLIVWLMVAVSKDFVPSSSIMVRVMQVVYEMASCPWKDELEYVAENSEDALLADDSKSIHSRLLFTAERTLGESCDVPFESQKQMMYARSKLMLRSMLLRSQYGGMAGDIAMIGRYVALWQRRFHAGAVPVELSKKLNLSKAAIIPLNADESMLSANSSSGTACEDQHDWWYLLDTIYEFPKNQGAAHVAGLIEGKAIQALALKDICLAGIDFHCSSVLESIVANDGLVKSVLDVLQELPPDCGICDDDDNHDRDSIGGKSLVLKTLKECMWKFSAGVNHRRALVVQSTAEEKVSKQPNTNNNNPSRDEIVRRIWDTMISDKVNAFAKAYVEDRLAH